jgi:Sporulation factor SpoIIGA.
MGECTAERVIYGDVLFLINFSMDFLTLCLTGKILRKKTKPLALTLSASFGAVYGVIAVLYQGNYFIGLVIGAAVSVLMCYIAFGRPLLLATALFNALGLLLGGAVTAAYMALGSIKNGYSNYNTKLDALPTRVPFGWTIVIASVFGIAAMIAARAAAKRHIAPEIEIIAKYKDKTITFNALTDSGNLLREPLSGDAVIITSYATLEPLLPAELRLIFRTGDTASTALLPFELMRRVRFIPAKNAGGDTLFIGFIPENIKAGSHDRAEACLAVSAGGEASREFNGLKGIAPALFG